MRCDRVYHSEALTEKRVLILGDSITHAGGWVVALESRLRCQYPDRLVQLTNLGLPSETIGNHQDDGEHVRRYGFPRPSLSQRLERTLDAFQPELVIACYGMNDGHGAAWNEPCFRSFQDGHHRLRDAIIQRSLQIVHCTPPAYDAGAPQALCHPLYDQVLTRYAEWLLTQRDEGWTVIDLHHPMVTALANRRRDNPSATFSIDGVHPDDSGHWAMAQGMFAALGDDAAVAASSLESLLPMGLTELPNLVRQRQELFRDAWLSRIPHTRPNLPQGLPFAEAETSARELEQRIVGLFA
jgi:lysophospholipase L1-like esterase